MTKFNWFNIFIFFGMNQKKLPDGQLFLYKFNKKIIS